MILVRSCELHLRGWNDLVFEQLAAGEDLQARYHLSGVLYSENFRLEHSSGWGQISLHFFLREITKNTRRVKCAMACRPG